MACHSETTYSLSGEGFGAGEQSVFQPQMYRFEGRSRGLIREVEPIGGTIVRLLWTSGREDRLDLLPALLASRSRDQLISNSELFASVRVGTRGSLLKWDDGSLLDASLVAALAERRMSNSEFKDAMELLGWSYAAMASQLEISERQVGNYRRDRPVPGHIALAVRYLLRLRVERYSNSALG